MAPHETHAAGVQRLQDACAQVALKIDSCSGMPEESEPHCRHRLWHGDDMQKKGPGIGCRMVCLNVAKKLYAHTEFKDEVVAAMQATGADIMLLTETGSADELARAAMRNYAI